jgi:hypothetical protein
MASRDQCKFKSLFQSHVLLQSLPLEHEKPILPDAAKNNNYGQVDLLNEQSKDARFDQQLMKSLSNNYELH